MCIYSLSRLVEHLILFPTSNGPAAASGIRRRGIGHRNQTVTNRYTYAIAVLSVLSSILFTCSSPGNRIHQIAVFNYLAAGDCWFGYSI